MLIVDDRVVGATGEVMESGVSLGMARREAEALAPFATVMIRDSGEEARRFEPVLERIEDLIPRVEVVSPGLVLIPIGGAVGFYGGETALARRVADVLEEATGQMRGGGAMIGIADGPFAARWAAATARVGEPNVVSDTIRFLSGLDLVALRESIDADELIDTFRWLGISTLGELSRLPREALATRFGSPGLLAHRLASGDDRAVDPRQVPLDLAVDAVFEEPLVDLDSVAFASRALSERLLKSLRKEGIAPHRVVIVAISGSGEKRERVWRSADPFTERQLSDRVWWQLRAWVESGGVPGGIARLRIEPADLSDHGRQLGLLQDETPMIEAGRALARAQALVGPDGVLQGRAQGGRMPQERVAWSRWGEPPVTADRDPSAPWPGSTPSPSPALVPSSPEPLEVEWDDGVPTRIRLGTRWEPVLTWSGPWRLSGRWWAGEMDVDRYQLVTSVGALLCTVSEGRAYLAGIYD
ncbi:MAG: DNA polymerase Y family protein [Acidimicrobiia bacterium]